MATKTLEFKIQFSDRQLAMVQRFLETSRHIWNYGLALLIEHEQFLRVYRDWDDCNEQGKPRWKVAPCCPLPWSYRRIDPQGRWEPGNMAAFCPILDRRKPYRMACPLPQEYREPRIGLNLIGKYSLQYYFAQQNHPNWPQLHDIGAWYCRGVCDALYKAWSEYKGGKRGKPRFKSVRDGYNSLSYGDGAKLTIEPVNATDAAIKIPKIGKLKVSHLYKDLGNLPIAVLRVVRKPNGWFLQVVCSKYPDHTSGPATAIVGLCPVGQGGTLAVDDQGREYTLNGDEPRLLKRYQALEQQAARQRRSLHRTQKSGEKSQGKNLAKTERKMARIAQLLAKRRQSQRQKVATYLARKSGAIAVIEPNSKLINHPKPNLKAGTFPAHYNPNGSGAVADINRSKAQHGLGEFVSLIKTKTAENNRIYLPKPKINKKQAKEQGYQALAKRAKEKL